jgi:hypothetical protein
MQFLGVVTGGQVSSVLAADDDAERLLRRWPDIEPLTRERANVRLLGVAATPVPAPERGGFDGGHVLPVTEYALEVMRELFSRDPTRAGFINHQRALARNALDRGLVRAARSALRLLVPEDFNDVAEAERRLDVLRARDENEREVHDAATALIGLAPRGTLQ